MALTPTKRVGLSMLAAVAAAGALAGPAMAGDDVNLSGNESATWAGGGTGAYLTYPLLDCGGMTPLDSCDATLVNAVDSDSLTITMTPSSDADDFDMFVYPNGDFSADPIEGTTGQGPGIVETVTIPNPAGNYLVEIVTFLSVGGTFTATATSTGTDPVADNTSLDGEDGATRSRQASLGAYGAALAAARR